MAVTAWARPRRPLQPAPPATGAHPGWGWLPPQRRVRSAPRRRRKPTRHRRFPRGAPCSSCRGSARSRACERSTTRAGWAGVTFLRRAQAWTSRASAMFAGSASGEKRGTVARKSPSPKRVLALTVPARKPMPSGLQGTRPMRAPRTAAGPAARGPATTSNTRSGSPPPDARHARGGWSAGRGSDKP